MRSFGRPTAPNAAVLTLVSVCAIAAGQTKVDMRSQARNIDFSAAGSTRPFPVGTALPALCNVGQTFFKSDAVPGQNLYFCTATNIWNVGAGNSLPTQVSNTGRILGTNGVSATWRTVSGFTDDGSRLLPDGTLVGELSGNNNWTGHQRFPASTTQTLTSSANKIVCNRRTIAIASAAPLTLSSAPTILDGADGQVCVIVNVGDSSITLQDQDTLPASNLQLAAMQVAIPSKGQITLQYNQTLGDWIQEGVPSNRLQDTGATGLVVQVGSAGLTTARTIKGVNGITVTNGDAVAGNPAISLPGSNKGDLIVHDGTGNTRLAAGPKRGHFLSADPAAPQGLSYIPGVYMYKSYLADTTQLYNLSTSPLPA